MSLNDLPKPKVKTFFLLNQKDEATGKIIRSKSAAGAAHKAMTAYVRAQTLEAKRIQREALPLNRFETTIALWDQHAQCIWHYRAWQHVKPGLIADHPPWFPIEDAYHIKSNHLEEIGVDDLAEIQFENGTIG